MSAYVMKREKFVQVANFVRIHGEGGPIGDRWLHVFHPETQALTGRTDYYVDAAKVANTLLLGNLESVAARYNNMLEPERFITERDLGPHNKTPQGVDMFGILRCMRYQSCEVDKYEDTLAHAMLLAVLWVAGSVAAEQAGAEAWG